MPRPLVRPITGPAFGPAAGGKPTWLLVLLHGFGADGNDLIGLGPVLGGFVPDARILAPDAPELCDMAPYGRQWFSLADRDPMVMYQGADRARIDIDAFLDDNLDALGLAHDRLILAGFSQGAMTALHVGLRRAQSPACILAYSGMLVGRNQLDEEMTCHPPVLLIHGEDDEVVPSQSTRDGERKLLDCGIDVMAHVLPDLGHGIDERGLMLTQKFLQRIGIAR